jgi:site-specific recombinase XerC
MCVELSRGGIRRDEVSMSRFSFSHLHSCNSSSLIRSSGAIEFSTTQRYTHLAMTDIIDAYNIAHPRA